MADPAPAILALEAQEPQGGAQPWSIGEAIGVGWRRLLSHGGLLVGALLLVNAFVFIVSFGIGFTEAVALGPKWVRQHMVLMRLSSTVTYPLFVLLQGGLYKMWLAAARDTRPELADLFAGGRYFWRLLALGLMQALGGLVGAVPIVGWA